MCVCRGACALLDDSILFGVSSLGMDLQDSGHETVGCCQHYVRAAWGWVCAVVG